MIYENIEGHSDRRVAFVTADKEGNIRSATVSKNVVSTDRTGYTFIVDDYVAEQISKFKVINGGLELIEGEELIEPEKTAEDIEREQLLARLAELDGA